MNDLDYRFITEPEEAQACLEVMGQETILGLDTETYWDRAANSSRLSLAQLAPAAGPALVIDALAVGIEPLRPLIEAPAPSLVAHNASFDQMMLAGAGLRPAGLIDTLRLARAALRLPSYSLAEVSRHLFGLTLDKSLQKSNWRRRPLTRAQIAYAAADARVALRVYEELRRLLQEQGKWETALRAATIKLKEEGAPQRQRRKLAPLDPPLTREEQRIVARLKDWRQERARAAFLPVYMICPDRTLEQMVRERPATPEALKSIYGLGAAKIARYGENLLAALRQALEE